MRPPPEQCRSKPWTQGDDAVWRVRTGSWADLAATSVFTIRLFVPTDADLSSFPLYGRLLLWAIDTDSARLMHPQETDTMPTNGSLNRKLRMGLVGGGQGAFIGRVHATAAVLDNRAALVAGALSSDAAKAKASAPDFDIKPERAYGSSTEMIPAQREISSPDQDHF